MVAALSLLSSFNAAFAAQDQAGANKVLADLPEWNLDDLYSGLDDPALKADFAQCQSEVEQFAADFQGKLSAMLSEKGGDSLAEGLKRYEAMQERMGKLISFAGLMYSGNTTDSARAKFYGDVQEKITTISTQLLFFELELNRVEDALLDDSVANSAALTHYKPWLDDLRKEKPYQLDDAIEKLFYEKSVTGAMAWNRLFDETMAGLRFSVEVDGETKELAIEQTLNLMTDSDGEKRRVAANALSTTFKDNLSTFSLISNVLAKDKSISDTWRGFEDVADSRHLANRVEREVVDALVVAVEDAYPRLSHRYYALKAKWFGKDALDHWDRNAPLPAVPTRTIEWPEAKDIVQEAYGGFAPEMAEISEQFFAKGWIDAAVREGKSPGAFAHPTVPSVHPYVLLNYMGKPRDVMTLAHELGHGVHQVLAAKQGALMAPTPLTLAETASVFGEMLTFRSLLAKTSSVAERRAMLAGKVEDMLNTVVRQIAFYLFERKLHTARSEGELTKDQICELWMSVQADSLGPSVRLGEGYETYWAYIPHFIHSPFYVYAYAFGDCLVNSLYSVYQNSDESFVQKYFDMLSAGGTKHHSELLAPFGLDASDPGFWSKGLSVVESLIDELEALEGA
ncbi:M3 family oligoendopeptidase [Cohaesibacter celericrescens]|uniref:Oligoendopeptidase F n=1 Tax=Cohaesibacter celericrescens TaxID=2067669 RepID=A0A2N5XLB5_9HYPH|nr:M3 family oligoendopeptidase [Cohaesibacter celericrescens]PLW75255.1 oligoendopeptidase F [Cohaesibacter celericrescens]